MSKMKSRIGAFLLASAMVLTMNQPVVLNAEESVNGDTVQQETAAENSAVPEEQQTDVQADVQADQQADAQADVQTDQQADEQADVQADQQADAQVDVQTDQQADVQADEQMKDQADETSDVRNTEGETSGKADINRPVLEKVEFLQQGQMLTDGDTVEFLVYAYDADSEISEVRVVLQYSTGENEYTTEMLPWEYDEARGCYVASMELSNVGTGKVSGYSITVVDTYSNYVTYDTPEDFWFETEGSGSDVSISEFYFPVNGQTMTLDELQDKIYDSWLDIDGEMSDDVITMQFAMQEGSYEHISLDFEWNENTGRYEAYSFGYSLPEPEEELTASFVLSDISVMRFGGYEHFTIDGMENYSVNVRISADEAAQAKMTSITLDKNQQIVRAGDQVKITVKVDNPDAVEDYGYAYFNSAADIDNSRVSIPLEYSEEEQAYTGVYEITETTYPCEWYLSDLNIVSKGGASDIFLGDFFNNSSYSWYFNVYNGDTFVDNVYDTTISFWRQAASGSWSLQDQADSVKVGNAGRRVTLRDLGIELPEYRSDIEGVTQTGWVDGAGNPVTEDTVLLNDSGYIIIYAEYDQNLYQVHYRYLADDDTVKYVDDVMTLEDGATIGDYREKAEEYVPDDMTGKYDFTGWGEMYNWADDNDSLYREYSAYFKAEYDGKLILTFTGEYFNKNGEYAVVEEPLILDEGASVEDAVKAAQAVDAPGLYPGLRFTGWGVEEDSVDVDNFSNVYANAEYENALIRYLIINPDDGGTEKVFCQVAEIGDTVEVLDFTDGYTVLEWLERPTEEDTFVVDASLTTFACYASASEDPDEPDTPGDEPGTPEEPDTPGTTPEEPDTPGTQLPDKDKQEIVEEIRNASEGGTVTVDMSSATVVPKEVLEEAKGRDVDIVLDMGSYTWTISGREIYDSNLKDIDLEVSMGTDNIPSSLVQELAKGRPVQQISLTHNGNFGFRASLTLNVGAQYEGKYGNLYYYDSDGRMVFMNAGVIGEDGKVSLDFSHASEYAIVISDEPMKTEAVVNPDTGKGEQNKGDDTNAADGPTGDGTVAETGDNANVVPVVVLVIVAAAVIIGCVVIRKKRK